jgi:nitrate reductase beta subunit
MTATRVSEPSKADAGAPAVLGWMLKSKGLSKEKMGLLLASRDQIRKAWQRDERGKKGFPLNTQYLLWELEARLQGVWRERKAGKIQVPYPKAPKRLRDILSEKIVSQVHEYLHEEPFQDALEELHAADAHWAALKRIQDTIVTALEVGQFGEQTLPKPRGNWLHRQMLRLIRAATSEHFTDSEMAELFEYLCPCGAQHSRETVKKFRWRHSRLHSGRQ